MPDGTRPLTMVRCPAGDGTLVRILRFERAPA